MLLSVKIFVVSAAYGQGFEAVLWCQALVECFKMLGSMRGAVASNRAHKLPISHTRLLSL